MSRKFYETFGDEIANELVEWFNQVDATYRADLRELNELNFARFDAKLEQRVSQLDAKLEQRVTELRAEFGRRFAELDAKLEQRVAVLRTEFGRHFAELDAKLERRGAETVKWMFYFWLGTVVPLGGLIVGLMVALH